MKKSLSLIVIFLLLLAVAMNFQNISDWLILKNYQPSNMAVQMSNDTAMTDNARKIFYVNRPAFDDKKSFSSNCTVDEQSIVLGCYIAHKGIYVLKVDEPKLSGVMQVTSAHEMLHSAYDRLPRREKDKINKELENAYKDVKNPRIRKNVDAYRAKDPSSVVNELHSILGTEVADLPPSLENYYAKYFKDRQKIVAYSSNYEQAFVSIKDQVESYDKQLDALRATIEQNQNDLKAMGDELAGKRKDIEQGLSRGRGEELNPQIDAFNAKVSEYNNLLNTTKDQIETYNSIVTKRNELVAQEKELIQAIDANINPLDEQ